MELKWIPTADVKVGDRIACLLSDARAYPTVTGWEDYSSDLTRYDLGIMVYRRFRVLGAPWWAEDMTSFALSDSRGKSACETLIVDKP